MASALDTISQTGASLMVYLMTNFVVGMIRPGKKERFTSYIQTNLDSVYSIMMVVSVFAALLRMHVVCAHSASSY